MIRFIMCLAVPGKVLKINKESRMAMVEFMGVRKEICIDFLSDIKEGEYLVAHAGFAISRLDPAEADTTLALMKRMGPGD